MKTLASFLCLSVCVRLYAGNLPLDQWKAVSPRDETMPHALLNEKAGRDAKGGLVLETGKGGHWIGCWEASVPVKGGAHYRFVAWRKTRNLTEPRRQVYARVIWQDEKGGPVTWETPAVSGYNKGVIPRAEPEYPRNVGGAEEWGRFEEVLHAPQAARSAKVELYLQWASQARVEWSDISLTQVEPPKPRKVRIAAVHFQPREGKEPMKKPQLFEPLIAEAGAKKCDLVVLPETLTYYGTGLKMHECAESIPGPSTKYFGDLAKKHDLHIVAGLIERDGATIYNTSALIGPDGKLIGKYRKVSLPRSEIEAGITPGHEYPVFDTRFGKVGMMICYDGFFPEVARQLTIHGAEVIAWPVWGCNPLLARARACENHVYLVSSTYTDWRKTDWMISGIFDHYGEVMVKADEFGTLAIAEVDLNERAHWNSLGDFKAQIESHRPEWPR
jgi:predicted amidohydrolase